MNDRDVSREDELARRLRAADPLRTRGQQDLATTSPAWLDALVEATMSAPTETETAPTSRPDPSRRRWLMPVAAAAVLAAVVTGSLTLLGGGDEPATQAKPASRVLTLPADEGGVMASCLPFSAETLSGMEVAFAATVLRVDEGSALLEVDRWYRGGEDELIEVRTPDPSTAALLGSVELTKGDRFLVTATDGTVNSCGFTMPWTEKDAAVFEQAFPG